MAEGWGIILWYPQKNWSGFQHSTIQNRYNYVLSYNTEVNALNRILVVEDEHSIADMVKMCLSKNGYICEVAYDGMTVTV